MNFALQMYYNSPKLEIFPPFMSRTAHFSGQNEKHNKFNCYLCALNVEEIHTTNYISWAYYKTSLQNTMCHNNLWPKAYTPISVR